MRFMKKIFRYISSVFKALLYRPNAKTFWYSIKYAPLCFKYYGNPEHNSIIDKQPWLVFPVIKILDNVMKEDWRIFEWGSGGSTLFFASRAKEVVSVEHNRDWFEAVGKELERLAFTNVKYELLEPEQCKNYDRRRISDPSAFFSDDDDSAGYDYEKYAKAITKYPDNFFDLIVIDGRARPSCMFQSLKKVKKNGIILLDQSERPHYLKCMSLFMGKKEWSKKSYLAPLPYCLHFSETTIYIKK